MLYVRSFVIFGAIRAVFSAIFGVLYKIISIFHLQPLLFCAVAGALAEIAFGWIGGSRAGFILFHLLLCLCVVYAVISLIFSILSPRRKREKRRDAAQIVSDFGREAEEEEKRAEPLRAPAPAADDRLWPPRPHLTREERPVYYRVRQNPEYVMAEYADRCELYREAEGRLIYVRTDYKER